ncbi:MAG TPA: diguanylate cyclase, partial [Herpetosiphonaceae bacterium]|nr:diguanylate cyclase [Herpetosiphonaceae bacterium]
LGAGSLIAGLGWMMTLAQSARPLSWHSFRQTHAENYLAWLLYLIPLICALLGRELARRRLVEQRLRHQRDFLQLVLDTMGEGVSVAGLDGSFIFVNQSYAAMLGMTPDDLLSKTAFDITRPEDRRLVEAALNERRHGRSSLYQSSLLRADGSHVPVMVHGVPYAQGGEISGTITVLTDLSRYSELERSLRREHDFISTVLETVHSLIIVLDPAGRVVHFNRACEVLTGYGVEDLRGVYFWDVLISDDERQAVRAVFAEIASNGVPSTYENRWITRAGEQRLISWANASVLGERGEIVYIIGTGTDVTDMRLLEQRREEMIELLHEQATRDSLTGLLNRRSFFEQAEAAYAGARCAQRPTAALMVDLDYFKQVNDSHGHAVGDEVLRIVARRCQNCLRPADIIGRYGGEEIAIVLPGQASEEAMGVARRMWRALAETPVMTPAGALSVTLSIGVAVHPRALSSLGDLLKRADMALYAAKNNGRNRVEMAPLEMILGAEDVKTPRP